MTLSIVLAALFFLLFVGCLIFLKKSLGVISSWESLFLDTLEDVESARNVFEDLVSRKSILSDDPEIIKLRQLFAIMQTILGEYIQYGNQIASKEERGEEEKEE